MSVSVSPPSSTTYPGVYSAKVYANNDPLNAGRVQMWIPQVFGSSPVRIWAPPLIPTTTPPSIGSVVWCLFQGGDAAYPTYLPQTVGGGGTQGPVGPVGPQGPAGPAGPAGDLGTLSYHYQQPTGSTTWVINHGLSFHPNVSVQDSTGHEIFPGDIQYTSATQVTLSFSAAVGGDAYLS